MLVENMIDVLDQFKLQKDCKRPCCEDAFICLALQGNIKR